MDVDVLSGKLFVAAVVLHWFEFPVGKHCLEYRKWFFVLEIGYNRTRIHGWHITPNTNLIMSVVYKQRK